MGSVLLSLCARSPFELEGHGQPRQQGQDGHAQQDQGLCRAGSGGAALDRIRGAGMALHPAAGEALPAWKAAAEISGLGVL